MKRNWNVIYELLKRAAEFDRVFAESAADEYHANLLVDAGWIEKSTGAMTPAGSEAYQLMFGGNLTGCLHTVEKSGFSGISWAVLRPMLEKSAEVTA